MRLYQGDGTGESQARGGMVGRKRDSMGELLIECWLLFHVALCPPKPLQGVSEEAWRASRGGSSDEKDARQGGSGGRGVRRVRRERAGEGEE